MALLKKLFNFRKNRTLILGIHGLSNKPPKKLLTSWWRRSLEEGLAKIDRSPTKFDFKMVYWADLLYKEPLRQDMTDPDHPLYIDEPYISEKNLKKTVYKGFLQKVKNLLQYLKEIIFLSRLGLNKFRRPFNMIVKIGFKDLDTYYNEEIPKNEQMFHATFKEQVRKKVTKILRKNRKKDILIIAHSMGSIIAYDVLLQLQKEIEIKGFIAMGSPMGLPLIRENIMKDHALPFDDEPSPPTPEGLESWYSYSDRDDNIGAFYNLADFYQPNTLGVKPIGKLVENNYKYWQTENAHKSFGYLRTREVAQVVSDFLSAGRSSLFVKGKQLFKRKGRGTKKPQG
ncbi:MAG: alpha/beta hydrolase [Reichenbachiella sp.]|uniref:lipase/acyltransferase domain-containing protein n=3 Tax=Reichenbachiella sp. TaxID=2184521 RepID=UPI003266E731